MRYLFFISFLLLPLSLFSQETYNVNGMVGAVAYPGGVTVTYEYDANGNMTRALANGVCFFEQAEYDGLRNVTRFGSARCRERLYPDDGFTAYRTIETGNGDEVDRINYTYDNSTKNVVQNGVGLSLATLRLNGTTISRTEGQRTISIQTNGRMTGGYTRA